MVLASATEALLCNIFALIRKNIKQPMERSNKPQCPDKGQLSPRSLWVKLSKRIIPTALSLLGCSPTPRPTSGVSNTSCKQKLPQCALPPKPELAGGGASTSAGASTGGGASTTSATASLRASSPPVLPPIAMISKLINAHHEPTRIWHSRFSWRG